MLKRFITCIAVLLLSTRNSHAFFNAFDASQLQPTSLTMAPNPINEAVNFAKKKLVTSLAGDYDKTATQAKLQNLISSNKILMFSFTK